MAEIEETIKSLKEMFPKGLCEVNEYKMAQVAINALEKQIPKKPKIYAYKVQQTYMGEKRKWRGRRFRLDYEYHNGVYCEVCGKTVCVLCNPQYDELTDCEEEYYSCPSCGKKIFPAYKCCDCGQKIDWSDSK